MSRDDRRDQVLNVAQDLFSAAGYHHVSMADIADRVEVSKPVLYRHFPSKLDLYLAVVDRRAAGLLSAIDAAVEPIETGPVHPGQGREVVAAIMRAYVDFVAGAGESAALLFETDVTKDPRVHACIEHAATAAARRIGVVLVDVTGLPPESARMLAAALTAMAQAAATYRFRASGGPTPEITADLVARLAWAGVAGLVRPDFGHAGSA
jgi:AcrR family transcriptional regulator